MFLTEQKSDLEKSKNELNGIIESMEELMKEHFGKQFQEINESFSLVFSELFGGGKGELTLSDPSNVLESGIEIIAQLPGKGSQNINLYSGGEKSFIAIALLFAILRVKPAPFCILDEIDAALDDVNVSRFATYLKNYIEQKTKVKSIIVPIVYALCAFASILVIISQFTDFYYYFDNHNFYHRNTWFPLSQIWGIIGIILDLILLYKYRKYLSKKFSL